MISEDTKFTLTIGQLRQLVFEAVDDAQLKQTIQQLKGIKQQADAAVKELSTLKPDSDQEEAVQTATHALKSISAIRTAVDKSRVTTRSLAGIETKKRASKNTLNAEPEDKGHVSEPSQEPISMQAEPEQPQQDLQSQDALTKKEADGLNYCILQHDQQPSFRDWSPTYAKVMKKAEAIFNEYRKQIIKLFDKCEAQVRPYSGRSYSNLQGREVQDNAILNRMSALLDYETGFVSSFVKKYPGKAAQVVSTAWNVAKKQIEQLFGQDLVNYNWKRWRQWESSDKDTTRLTLTIGQIRRLVNEMTVEGDADEITDERSPVVPPPRWKSDADNTLPDLRIGRLLPSLPRLKEQAIDLCKRWCATNLKSTSDEDLDAAIKGRKIKEWHQFVQDCNIPTSRNITSQDIYDTAWECFQEQCFDEMMGEHDLEEVDESLQSTLGLALISTLLSLGNILRADEIKSGLQDATSPKEAQIVLNAIENKTYGGYSTAQAVNILMRTLYAEARNESALGKRMVATVIWNRAGGEVDRLPGVCLKKKQFSCWNGLTARDPGNFMVRVPKGATRPGANQDAWNECKALVESMLNGTFTPEGNYNMYLNKATADKSAVDGWGTSMGGQRVVGHHTFGYLKDQDGFRKNKTEAPRPQYATTCRVQDGDYGVSYVARRLIRDKQTSYTDVRKLTDQIIALNPKLKTDRKGNPIIRVGDVLNLPS